MDKNKINADEALELLLQGNARYVEDQEQIDTSHSTRQNLVSGQAPFAIVLSCADSRVLPEAIFDANAGQIFVVRVAGNIANTSSIASIEYAVAHLGTRLIMVLGHESCGAVGAALAGGDNGYNLNHLVAHITPAIARADNNEVNTVVKKNAEVNAEELANRSSIISNALNQGLKIVPAYYSLSSGKVELVG